MLRARKLPENLYFAQEAAVPAHQSVNRNIIPFWKKIKAAGELRLRRTRDEAREESKIMAAFHSFHEAFIILQ
jgi:hypothetical protein